MATHYGLRCRTCGEDSATWIRSCPEVVAELVRCYPTVRQILALGAELPYPIEVEVSYLGVYDDPPHLFLAGHAGHDLVVYDEYGRDHPEIVLPKEAE